MLTVSHKYTCYLASSFNATAELTLRGVIWGSTSSEELKIRTTFPRPGCFQSMLAYVIHPQNTTNRSCVCASCTLSYESVRFIETTACQ